LKISAVENKNCRFKYFLHISQGYDPDSPESHHYYHNYEENIYSISEYKILLRWALILYPFPHHINPPKKYLPPIKCPSSPFI
jgi:hypothetical protein